MINYVEGLSQAVNLQELYLANQKLEDGFSLKFDPCDLRTLSRNLIVLNVSNCNIIDCSDVSELHSLEKLNLSKNKIESMEEVSKVLENLYYLQEVDFRQNPISKFRNFNELCILTSQRSLRKLDSKEITMKQREDLRSFAAHRQRSYSI